ncbi:MAG: NAD(P)-binding domain-containing protein [Bacteroidota bacterium]
MQKYLIIGAGPAGLAAAVALQKAAIDFEIVDAGDKVGGIWDIDRAETPMYQSAHFISSRTLSGFADLPMPDDYPDYPSHRLVQAYIESYALYHQLNPHIRFKTKVLQLKRQEQHWQAHFDDGLTDYYQGVICATGITWHQNLPEIPGDFQGELIHSFDYKDDSQFRGKSVLIIGAGNSGCDIACDAARAAKNAFISMRRGYYFLPKYTFGMPSDLFKEKYALPNKYLDTRISELLLNKVLVGDLRQYGLPKPDHHLMESHPIMNNRLLHYLGHGDIKAKGDVAKLEGQSVRFADGSSEQIDLIVAATGYKRVFPFLEEEQLDKKAGKEIDLYLEVFSKKYDDLFFVGGIEVSSAIFGLLNLQGELIASYLKAQEADKQSYQAFLQDKRQKDLNLKGKNKYIDSLRHQRYTDKKLYRNLLSQQIRKFTQ